MKKKLLITLGCSYTEGMGCYDEKSMPPGADVYSTNLLSRKEIEYQRGRFHAYGWPNRVGKKLGYDKVLNLGFGGGSTSGNLKQFMEHYWEETFSEYEVLIFWWLPASHRISFYSDDLIHHIIPPGPENELVGNDPHYLMGREYLNFTKYFPEDTYLEQIFYLKLMANHCKLKNFKFIWYVDNEYIDDTYFNQYPAKDKWIGTDSVKINHSVYPIKKYRSNICGHPNELGYEVISNIFFESIKQNHSYLIERPSVDDIRWEWKGNPEYNFQNKIKTGYLI